MPLKPGYTPTAKQIAARIQPGETRNPKGRPWNLERRVRELVNEDDLINALHDIAMGRLPPGITGETTVKIKDRLMAIQMLTDRGAGKPKAVVEHVSTPGTGFASLDVDRLDPDGLEELEAKLNEFFLARADKQSPTKVLEAHSVVVSTEVEDK